MGLALPALPPHPTPCPRFLSEWETIVDATDQINGPNKFLRGDFHLLYEERELPFTTCRPEFWIKHLPSDVGSLTRRVVPEQRFRDHTSSTVFQSRFGRR